MKELIGLLRKLDLTSSNMCMVVIQNAELDFTIEATGRWLKVTDSNNEKADLEQVTANATQMNAE